MSALRLTLLVLALGALGCRPPADLAERRGDYERLVLLRLQDPDAPLWFTSNAPAEARTLMLRLRLDAAVSHHEAGWVELRAGGGYGPRHGYVFALDRADTSALHARYGRLEALGEGWYRY